MSLDHLPGAIRVFGARVHNLKDIDVDIPLWSRHRHRHPAPGGRPRESLTGRYPRRYRNVSETGR